MKVGDMVRSKAGGPRMVINDILIAGVMRCVWWSKNDGAFKSQDFHPTALVSAAEEEPERPRVTRGTRNPGIE